MYLLHSFTVVIITLFLKNLDFFFSGLNGVGKILISLYQLDSNLSFLFNNNYFSLAKVMLLTILLDENEFSSITLLSHSYLIGCTRLSLAILNAFQVDKQ